MELGGEEGVNERRINNKKKKRTISGEFFINHPEYDFF